MPKDKIEEYDPEVTSDQLLKSIKLEFTKAFLIPPKSLHAAYMYSSVIETSAIFRLEPFIPIKNVSPNSKVSKLKTEIP